MKEKDVKRGGVIPYYIDEDEQIQMLFMKPSDPKYGGKKFQIAKGKIDPEDNSVQEGAFREAQEELGLFMPNVLEQDEVGAFGTITVFIGKIKDTNQFGQHDHETGAVKWMTPEKFEADGRKWQRPIVKAAVRLIKRKNENTQSG